jgi:hypothetical protein
MEVDDSNHSSIPEFKGLGPVNKLSKEEQKQSKRVIKFEYRIIRKTPKSTPYFIGVALKADGGIDFYHNYTLVF